jgi:hypothetical protein
VYGSSCRDCSTADCRILKLPTVWGACISVCAVGSAAVLLLLLLLLLL